MTITFSRRLAIVAGILLPLLETIRRRHEFPGPINTWDSWLDDYAIGAFLLFGAWMTRPRKAPNASLIVRHSSLLSAAWGFACGIGFISLMSQMHRMHDAAAAADPSGLPHGWMVAIKAALLLLALLGLAGSLPQDYSGK